MGDLKQNRRPLCGTRYWYRSSILFESYFQNRYLRYVSIPSSTFGIEFLNDRRCVVPTVPSLLVPTTRQKEQSNVYKIVTRKLSGLNTSRFPFGIRRGIVVTKFLSQNATSGQHRGIVNSRRGCNNYQRKKRNRRNTSDMWR